MTLGRLRRVRIQASQPTHYTPSVKGAYDNYETEVPMALGRLRRVRILASQPKLNVSSDRGGSK